MNEDRINKLEEELQPPQGDLDLIVRYETSVRTPDDTLVRMADETASFPEGFKVSFESESVDGSKYRVWHPTKNQTP